MLGLRSLQKCRFYQKYQDIYFKDWTQQAHRATVESTKHDLVTTRHRETTSNTATSTTQSTFPNTPVEMLQEDFKVSSLTYFSLSELKDPNGFPSMTPKGVIDISCWYQWKRRESRG